MVRADAATASLAAPNPVQWLVLDRVSMDDIDSTAGLMLAATLQRLQKQNITVALAQIGDVRVELDRFGIIERLGAAHLHGTVPDDIEAYHQR